jgi:hypothetical protein
MAPSTVEPRQSALAFASEGWFPQICAGFRWELRRHSDAHFIEGVGINAVPAISASHCAAAATTHGEFGQLRYFAIGLQRAAGGPAGNACSN